MIKNVISEVHFRRGYLHGYDKAMDDLKDLLQEGMSLERAYNLIVAFLNEKLSPWREQNRDEFIEPPSFSEWRRNRYL